MIVESLSKKMATYLHENSTNKEKFTYNKLHYGLQISINFLIVFSLLAIASNLLGIFNQTMTLFVMIAILRQSSGGVHLESSELCTLVSTVSVLAIAILSVYIEIPFLDYITVILLILYAPATFKVMYKSRKKTYIIMKIISILVVLINLFFIKCNSVSIAFIIQSLSVFLEHQNLKKKVRG